MRLLLDTNLIVDNIHDGKAWERVRTLYAPFNREESSTISTVTAGELESLASRNNWGVKKLDQMAFCLAHLTWIDVAGRAMVHAYSVIDTYSVRSGFSLSKNDLWIAATAYITGSLLLSTDKDFLPLTPKLIQFEWIDPN